MSLNCAACGGTVLDELFVKCTKKHCDKVYDLQCLGLKQSCLPTEYKRQWVCPECVCASPKPLRNTPDTPVRGTINAIEENTYPTSGNVNTKRGSRSKTTNPESRLEYNDGGILLKEFRLFRLEVLERLNMQANDIKYLQEVCISTKTELEYLRTNMKVIQDQLAQKELLPTINRMDESSDSSSVNLKSSVEVTKQIAAPSTYSEVARSDHNLNNSSTTTRVSRKIEATKTASGHSLVTESQPPQVVNQPHTEMVDDLNSCNKAENIENHGWIEVQKNKGRFQSKKVLRGKNMDTAEIQATERKRHLHVWRLSTETTVEKLMSHVKSACGAEVFVKIEKIKHKAQRDYASFIITVPESAYEKLFQPDMWPVNTEFSEWIWFRKSSSGSKKENKEF